MIGSPGTTVTLPVEYRTGAGVLVDPTGPLLHKLTDPNGVDVLVDVAPARDDVGRYHVAWFAPYDAALGTWTIRWTGTIDGAVMEGDDELDLVAPSPSNASYGTTVDDVRGLLPHRSISDISKPTAAQVAGFITIASDWISNRLGDLAGVTPAQRSAAAANARGLAALGAAALTEEAGSPERAGMADGGYGGWLWQRFKEGVDEALEALSKPTVDLGGGGEAPVGDHPAIVAPIPLFYRDVGF